MSQEPSLLEQYAQLCQLSDSALAPLKRKRGFDFERVLKRLLDADGLEPRSRLEFNAPVKASTEFLPYNLSTQFGKEFSDGSN